MNPGFRSTLLVARREAQERVRSRAFIVSTVITLLIVGVIISVAVVVADDMETFEIGIYADAPPTIDASVAASALAAGAETGVVRFDDSTLAREAVADGTVDAAIINDGSIVVRSADSSVVPVLTDALTFYRLVDRLEKEGLDASLLVDAAAITVDATDPLDNESNAVGLLSVVLLFTVITLYGQWVLLGVLEEKSNRIVELLLSSTSVRSLLTGKILGIGVLGVLQLTVLVIIGLGAAGLSDAISLPEATYGIAIWSVVWFLLGFAFYASLFAAAGALISRTEDAQAATIPVTLVGIVAYIVAFALIVPNPDTTAARVLSLIPPIAPIAFPARLGTGVPLWELALGMAITIAGIAFIVRVAARIYAGAILLSGGRIKLRQAWQAAGELASR